MAVIDRDEGAPPEDESLDDAQDAVDDADDELDEEFEDGEAEEDEETRALAGRVAEWQRSDELFAQLPDPGAREELVMMHQPLAEYLARRFSGRGEALEDLTQVAMVALIKAIDRFDTEREVKFSTYATATIVGELKRHFRDKGWALRVPRRLQETGLRVSRVVSELSQELGRSPTVKEIAVRTGLSEEEVLEGMDTVHAYSTASLDAPIDEEGGTAGAQIGHEDETLEVLEGWASVAPALRRLPARERRILYLRFFRGFSQTKIAEELGISQMHVSRLLSRTLRQLRDRVMGEG
ncbi:MAG TPA: SigB/SigF/SigG family RNA polymerase sigma factor [Actinomycetota bacterium]|nr:SigB/SigF/SigG family RNA polymerase sigma factor [Actinomycetota bacterium]